MHNTGKSVDNTRMQKFIMKAIAPENIKSAQICMWWIINMAEKHLMGNVNFILHLCMKLV